MIIRDILNLKGSTIFSIAPDGRVADAVATMVQNDIGSLVVMTAGKMTGMLTFREVLKGLPRCASNPRRRHKTPLKSHLKPSQY